MDTGSGGTSTGVAVTAGQWQHIAVVFDPAGIRFYKDGVETAMAVPNINVNTLAKRLTEIDKLRKAKTLGLIYIYLLKKPLLDVVKHSL